MDFDLSLNLQRMSAVKYATFLWEQPRFRFKRDEFLNSKENLCTKGYKAEEWNDLIKEVLDEIGKKSLPLSVTEYLANVIYSTGRKMFYWALYVKRKLRLDVKYAFNLCWTSYGTINRLKIIDQKWLNDAYLVWDYGPSVCYAASTCALLPVLNKRVEFILDYADEYFSTKDTSQNRVYRYLLSSLMFLNVDVSIINEADEDWLNPSVRSNVGNMFRQSIIEGGVNAVQYYWNVMGPADQKEHLVEGATKAVKLYQGAGDKKKSAGLRESYVEIFTFLFSKMTKEERVKLLKKFGANILKMYLCTWPWQELFIPIFESVKQELNATKINGLLYDICAEMKELVGLGYSIDGSIYQSIFSRFWKAIPVNIKLKMVKVNKRSRKMRYPYYLASQMESLFEVFDLVSLNLIINDECLKPKRERLIRAGYPKFIGFVENQEFSMLDKFMKEVLTSDDERKKFKLQLDFYDHFIKLNQFDVVDKFLNWQCESVKGKKEVKNQIDAVKICKILLEVTASFSGSSALLEKYVQWQCSSPADITELKRKLKSEKFISDKIGCLWVKFDPLQAVSEMDKFLKWLSSERGVKFFKKEIISDVNFIESILKSLLRDGPRLCCDHAKLDNHVCHEAINGFLKYCSATQSEIKDLKYKINVNADYWVKEFGIKLGSFAVLDSVLDWACTKEQKKKIVANFLESQNGYLFCCKLYEQLNKWKDEDLQRFLNTWVKSSPAIPEIKNKIKKLDEKLKAIKAKTGKVPWFPSSSKKKLLDMLDVLEKGGKVILKESKKN